MECVYNHSGITCACATDGLTQCRYKVPADWTTDDENVRRTDLSKRRGTVTELGTWFDEGVTFMSHEPQLGGRKDDTGKLPWHLLPWDAVRSIVKVLQFGAAKYAPRNWEKGMDWERPYAACIRHLTDWWERAPSDPETGFSHLWHAGCCIVFLIAYEIRGVGKDTRPTNV